MRKANYGGVTYSLRSVSDWDFRVIADAAIKAAAFDNPTIVEVGTSTAMTARALLHVLRLAQKPPVHYIGIDISEDAHVAFTKLIADEAKLGNTSIEFMRAPSPDIADAIMDESCGLVFVDACHCFDCAVKDIAAWVHKVRRGGFLAFHDANPLQESHVQPEIAETHPGARIHGVARALEAQASLLAQMGFVLHEIGKPGPQKRHPEGRAWTAVYQRRVE